MGFLKIKEELDVKLKEAFDSQEANFNGTLELANGGSIQGSIINGEAQGYCIWKASDGYIYRGNFVDSELCGSGSILTPDGRLYEGNFQNGVLVDGILYVNNRKFYQGAFDEHFRPNGQYGTLWFDSVSTDCDGYRYEGEFHNGRPNGQGTFFYPNGARYSGECKDGYPHGYGMFYSSNGNIGLRCYYEKGNFIRWID